MRFLLTLIVLAAIAVGGYYFIWLENMSRYVMQVKNTVTHLNEKFEPHGVTISYDALEAGGYPLSSHVRLVNPKVDYDQDYERVRIGLAEIVLTPAETSEKMRYDVDVTQPVFTRFEHNNKYSVAFESTVAQLPMLYFRPDPDVELVEGEPLPVLEDIGIKSVGAIDLTIQRDGEERRANFPRPRTPFALWYDIPADISYPIKLFAYMQDEAFLIEPSK